MERRVTSNVAAVRSENGRGPAILGPDTGSASGRSAVTKPDNGVVPASSRTAQAATHGSVGVAELTHTDVRNSLSDYLDNSLAQAERRRIDGHLTVCRPCTAFLATLRTTIRVAETLPRPKAPAHARARILEAARHQAAEAAASDGAADDDSAAAADA
jgi:putative zinc finger protein